MKKVAKLLGLVFLIFVFGFLIFRYSWHFSFSDTTVHFLDSTLSSVKPIPKEMAQMASMLNSMSYKGTMNEHLANAAWDALRNKRSTGCPCYTMINQDWYLKQFIPELNKTIGPIRNIQLAYMLEDLGGAEECFHYAFRFQYREVSKSHGYSFSDKSVDSLNRQEMLDYFIAEKGPIIYRPDLHPEKYAARKKMIEEKIKHATN